jgi:hypothetical protein
LVTHTKEQGLRVSDNRVLRKISGYEREGATGSELRQKKTRPIYREVVGKHEERDHL